MPRRLFPSLRRFYPPEACRPHRLQPLPTAGGTVAALTPAITTAPRIWSDDRWNFPHVSPSLAVADPISSGIQTQLDHQGKTEQSTANSVPCAGKLKGTDAARALAFLLRQASGLNLNPPLASCFSDTSCRFTKGAWRSRVPFVPLIRTRS